MIAKRDRPDPARQIANAIERDIRTRCAWFAELDVDEQDEARQAWVEIARKWIKR